MGNRRWTLVLTVLAISGVAAWAVARPTGPTVSLGNNPTQTFVQRASAAPPIYIVPAGQALMVTDLVVSPDFSWTCYVKSGTCGLRGCVTVDGKPVVCAESLSRVGVQVNPSLHLVSPVRVPAGGKVGLSLLRHHYGINQGKVKVGVEKDTVFTVTGYLARP